MARNLRGIPQKTLSSADRAVFEEMIARIAPVVGVHLDKQPHPFFLDTRILLDMNRFPVSRPTQPTVSWGGYFTYSPTYAALSPEQRWNYIAWLVGDERVGIHLFRIMRLHALAAEFGGPRRAEAVTAIRQLYEQSQSDAASLSSIGNVLTLAYAATDPAQLSTWLKRFEPTQAMGLDLLARCYGLSALEAPGRVLLEIASRCSFKLARGMSGRRDQIEAAIAEIAVGWQARQTSTVIRSVLEQTPLLPALYGYNDSLLMWATRTLGLPQGTLAFERGESAEFMRGLAAAAQEQIRSQRRGSTPLDGLQLLDGILNGDGGSVQFDLSGSAGYTMTSVEAKALKRKLSGIEDLPGIAIVAEEWAAFSTWNNKAMEAPDATIISSLPIKTPTSDVPWNTPAPPTFAGASYRVMTPEQRWWYLDWLAGAAIEPLPVFVAVRFKGLEAAFRQMSRADRRAQAAEWMHYRDEASLPTNVVGMIERLFEQSDDEMLGRAALEILLPMYAEYHEPERATQAFNRVPLSIEQASRMLGILWEADGRLLGRGLLHVARAGGFNHTPLTRECFDQIAERAEELLAEWEVDFGPLSDLPPSTLNIGFNRSRRSQRSGINVSAEIARDAQEQIKVARRSAPRSARMSDAELEAERVELADLPTHAGDAPSEMLYRHMSDDPAFLAVYLSNGVASLEDGDPAAAVAFLRRAYDIDARGPAERLLALARMRLAEQQTQEIRG